MWQVKGIDTRSANRTMPAWLYLVTHGLCIDKNGTPVPCHKAVEEGGGRFDSYRRLGVIMHEGIKDGDD